jgi:hypothetical protein
MSGTTNTEIRMDVKPFIVSRRQRPGAERGTHMEMFKGSAFISQTHESPESCDQLDLSTFSEMWA